MIPTIMRGKHAGAEPITVPRQIGGHAAMGGGNAAQQGQHEAKRQFGSGRNAVEKGGLAFQADDFDVTSAAGVNVDVVEARGGADDELKPGKTAQKDVVDEKTEADDQDCDIMRAQTAFFTRAGADDLAGTPVFLQRQLAMAFRLGEEDLVASGRVMNVIKTFLHVECRLGQLGGDAAADLAIAIERAGAVASVLEVGADCFFDLIALRLAAGDIDVRLASVLAVADQHHGRAEVTGVAHETAGIADGAMGAGEHEEVVLRRQVRDGAHPADVMLVAEDADLLLI